MKTIEFYSEVPGLAEIAPIIPAKDYTAKWMLAARQEYIDMLKSSQLNSTHIYQCPGIFDLFNQGWIVPMWHDVLIKTENNKNSFAYMYPSDNIVNSLSGREPVSRHADELAKFIPKRPWSLNPVIKFNTPWHIIAPKGVKFIVLPINYPDTFEFESATGILDPGHSNEINFQVFWNVLNAEYVLKAGTPMCHIIPLSDEKFKVVCRDMNDSDKKWNEKYKFLRGFTFTTKRNIIKDMYHTHFRK